MSRIYQYPVVTEIGNDDYLALGSAMNGSRAILASDLAPVIGSKTITERGTYKASDDNMDGYGQVTVDIPYTDIHVASGDIATFEGEDLPLKSLKVSVTPYQDLHGYDGPWAGGAGKNKFHFGMARSGYTWSDGSGFTNIGSDDAFITIVGTATSPHTFSVVGGKFYLEAGTYIISVSKNDTLQVVIKDANENNIAVVSSITGAIFTIETGQYCTYSFTILGGATASTVKIQIESGSTVSEWSPYSNICPIIGWDEAVVTVADDAESPTTSHEYTINLDGTRYGGVVDATNGTMTVDREIAVFDGSSDENWIADADVTSSDNFVCFRAYLQNNNIKKPEGNYIGKMFSNTMLTLKNGYANQYPMANIVMGITGYSGANNNYFYINVNKTLSSIQSVAELRTWLAENPTTVVYELATPITVQLAPQPVKSIEGENNIFANCGAVDVEYQTVWVRPTN